MPILGRGGILEFSREWPEPLALTQEAVNTDSITIQDSRFWAGDRILVAAAGGVPFDLNGDGYADCPDGHGIYRGSFYALGPARAFYTGPETNEDGPHYQASDAVAYYNTAATTGLSTLASGYITRDLLDRIKLWSSQASGLNGGGADPIPIRRVAFGNFALARFSSNAAYQAALVSAAAAIAPLQLPEIEQPLADVISLSPAFATIADDADARGWLIQGLLEEWALDVDAASLDMTAIGDTFGEAVKALVRGAGSLRFIVDLQSIAGQQDSTTLLRLVLLTQQGAKTAVKFYLLRNRAQGPADSALLPGSIYYETELLLTNSRINLRADDMVEGTTDFVATGRIDLRVGA